MGIVGTLELWCTSKHILYFQIPSHSAVSFVGHFTNKCPEDKRSRLFQKGLDEALRVGHSDAGIYMNVLELVFHRSVGMTLQFILRKENLKR